ncbi:hypothetical protein [Francisella hispaniensis]|uniref:Uncharacterized protein n=1 Tax=Francisella hispaniensis TaxID=622488 RepID=F4BKA8_9GAMM|nr:hypothetical protein [Francisella hispaniensis]AEB28602.1 hypothetical protein FN3523_0745 [Francisella hispaniensis]
MKKLNPKKIAIVLLAVGGVCLVAILAIRPYLGLSVKENNSTNWNTIKEKANDARNTAAIKTQESYDKTKDTITPDHTDKS